MRFATRGVPRARRATSSAASSAISTPRIPAERAHDRRELVLLVVAEPERHAEAVAQRRREKPRPRRRADEGERRKIERQRPCARALSDDDVEPEVLERRVEDLLDRAVHAMDLVDEEDVLLVEAREDRRHVALSLERRPRDRADADVELLADDRRERRLPEAGWTDEQDVVERLAAGLRRLQRDVELLLRALLADEVVESPRPQRLLDLLVAFAQGGCEELARHAALRSASRTRSSAGSSGSTAGERLLRLDERVSELDERVARDELARSDADAGGQPTPRVEPSSSRTMRSAVFLPIPGIAWNRAESFSAIARWSSSGDALETTASATFGPMPLTPRSWTKSDRSAASAKP